MRKHGGANDRTGRAGQEYLGRLAVRMDEERAAGTVFFRGPVEACGWELKMTADGVVVCVRSQLVGENFTEHRAYRLVRLEGWEGMGSKVVMSGDFLYDSDEWIYGIRPWRARPVRKRLVIPGPFENMDVLAHALDTAPGSEGEQGGGRLRGFLRREVAEPAAGIALTPAVLPAAMVDSALYSTAQCTVMGFETSDGKSHPVFEFTAPDGTRVSGIDTGPAIEDTYDECTASRILCWSLPREATVRYRRDDSRDCRCTVL